MVADLAAPLLPEYLHAREPIAVPDAETTICCSPSSTPARATSPGATPAR